MSILKAYKTVLSLGNVHSFKRSVRENLVGICFLGAMIIMSNVTYSVQKYRKELMQYEEEYKALKMLSSELNDMLVDESFMSNLEKDIRSTDQSILKKRITSRLFNSELTEEEERKLPAQGFGIEEGKATLM